MEKYTGCARTSVAIPSHPILGARYGNPFDKYELWQKAGGHGWANDSFVTTGPNTGYLSNYVPVQLSLVPPQNAPLPQDGECEIPQSFAFGRICVGIADGSVRSVSLPIDPYAWALLLLPRDGSVLPPDAQ